MSEETPLTIEDQIRKDYFRNNPTIELESTFTYKDTNKKAKVIGYSEGPRGLVVDYDTFRNDGALSSNNASSIVNVRVDGREAKFGIRYVPEDLTGASSYSTIWRIVGEVKGDGQDKPNEVVIERPVSNNGRAGIDTRTVPIKILLGNQS